MVDIETEKKHFNALAQKQASQWWGNKTPTGQWREEYRADLIAREVPVGKEVKILDVGCSAGGLAFKLAQVLRQNKKSAKITGIDISDQLIQLAKGKNTFSEADFKEGNIAAMPFLDNYFDIVYGNAILHHLNLKDCLPEIIRVLKPCGKAIFFEPNLLNPEVFIEKKVKFIGRLLQNSPDETAFTKGFIKRQLTNNLFKNMTVKYFDFYHPLIPFWFVRNFRWLFNLLERAPLIKNISGSLIIYGEK